MAIRGSDLGDPVRIDVAFTQALLFMHTTSVSLLQPLRQPSANDAWAKFVDLYTPLIYYWARRMGLTSHETDDVVQDVLTILVRKMRRIARSTIRARAFEAG